MKGPRESSGFIVWDALAGAETKDKEAKGKKHWEITSN